MLNRRLALVVPLVLVLATPVAAFDLTGTWTGTRKCKFFDAGVRSKVDREGTVVITQSANSVGFRSDIGSSHLYHGIANFGTEKPDKGELSVRHCDNHMDAAPFDAIGRFTVSTKPGRAKATISGISIVANDTVLSPSHGTCKWKLTRTTTFDSGGVSTNCDIVLSRRAAKTDVAYLSESETKRLHDELMAYRLATYRYASPSTSPGSHLGFIIDDVAPSPAIAASGDHVDHYAYTSMAVAALQTQAREIERLRAAVAKLETRSAGKLRTGASP